jgi:hypothetical protein
MMTQGEPGRPGSPSVPVSGGDAAHFARLRGNTLLRADHDGRDGGGRHDPEAPMPAP